MRAVVPEVLLDERRRLGLDRKDELWDGVLHMVPPPGDPHQGLSAELFLVLGPLAKARGLVPRMETGLFRTRDDYRVPDQLYRRPDAGSSRGAESAELVVEILSPGDETVAKLPWYAELGVREVLVLDPDDRTARLFRGATEVDAMSEVLGVAFASVEQALCLSWDGGSSTL
ncbi:Uma2 family endonuclease [Actinomycetospora termitidis]|uniref:Uma2 family endonuclease n=1 Tax=Actinomycetospora termitidis TaxID=3053470 RepID=A0ABT7MDF0_9PSEU|nr:Uma2 family endonuclease [Actinomycetospora sp. Odt1-22]MDL5158692.1 Uma2 family endonuclease [Actinomycetospora sp. Odt1-22]